MRSGPGGQRLTCSIDEDGPCAKRSRYNSNMSITSDKADYSDNECSGDADGDTPDDSKSKSSDDADGDFLRRKKKKRLMKQSFTAL